MKPIQLASALSILLAMACGRQTTAPSAEAPIPVRLAVSLGSGGEGWVAANLVSESQATLSTRLAASVKKVWVEEGAKVAAGQLLVSLSDEDLQSQLRAAQSGQVMAAAYHRRITALAKEQAATPSELEQANAQLAQADSAVAAVKAQLSYAQIRAPFAGIVQRRMVQEGDMVGPGQQLIQLEGSGGLELQASLSEPEAKGLKVGQSLTFVADGQTGKAKLTALASAGDALTHRRTLRAKVESGSGFAAGAFARIRVPGSQAQAGFLIPKSALVQRGDLDGVFVFEDGKASLRWIRLGEIQGEQVSVAAGLGVNDKVLADPSRLHDGQPVKLEGAAHGQ